MKKSKVERKWIPGARGRRGHFSTCKRGHPWKSYGPCAECRTQRDAERHSTKENKSLEADRKRRKRWAKSTNKGAHTIPGGYIVEILRGGVLIDSGSNSVILSPEQVAKLYELIHDNIATNYPSKLPKAFRETAVKNPYTHKLEAVGSGDWVCGGCGVKGTGDELSMADYHKPGCSEAAYCKVKTHLRIKRS